MRVRRVLRLRFIHGENVIVAGPVVSPVMAYYCRVCVHIANSRDTKSTRPKRSPASKQYISDVIITV